MIKKPNPVLTTRAHDDLTDHEKALLRSMVNGVLWSRNHHDQAALFCLQRFGLVEPSVQNRPTGPDWDAYIKLGFKITPRGLEVLAKLAA